jgi:hypothetical protein
MQELPLDPSAAVWNWRQAGEKPAQTRSREAAAARKRATVGLGIGLAAAAALYFLWKPGPAYVVAAVSLVLFLIALIAPLTLHKRVTRALEIFAPRRALRARSAAASCPRFRRRSPRPARDRRRGPIPPGSCRCLRAAP